MINGPRAVFGAPLYNQARHLSETLESLLAQTHSNIAVVLVDDGSVDDTPILARTYADLDARVTYVRNPQRLGYIRNARRAFELAHELYPKAPYFAWASDHDVWHPRWAEMLVRTLDESPDAVLAYPLNVRISDTGEFRWEPWPFETHGLTRRRERFARALEGMAAGNMIYGLFRVSALERAGLFAPVLLPDRFLLAQIALLGTFRQVPEVLWYRRFWGLASVQRQRAAFFPDGAPFHTYLPWMLPHVALLAQKYVWQGESLPEISRREGAWVAWTYLWRMIRLVMMRRSHRIIGRVVKVTSRAIKRLRKTPVRIRKAMILIRALLARRAAALLKQARRRERAAAGVQRAAMVALRLMGPFMRIRRVRGWAKAYLRPLALPPSMHDTERAVRRSR